MVIKNVVTLEDRYGMSQVCISGWGGYTEPVGSYILDFVSRRFPDREAHLTHVSSEHSFVGEDVSLVTFEATVLLGRVIV